MGKKKASPECGKRLSQKPIIRYYGYASVWNQTSKNHDDTVKPWSVLYAVVNLIKVFVI